MATLNLNTSVICLRLLAYIAIVAAVVHLSSNFRNGSPLPLVIDGEMRIFRLRDLGGLDFVVPHVFRWMSVAPWMAAMWHIERFARLAARGDLLSPATARRFRKLSSAVLGFAVLEVFERPTIAVYLSARDLLPALPDLGIFDVRTTSVLLLAALFAVIARIVEQAVLLKDDADLTI